ncbi:MAG: hypothetical protein J6U85_01625 [Bacteroidales bacterium]|jgi:hypothetical protein|nr:hypothetical protein [Bacteroidales bacterium]
MGASANNEVTQERTEKEVKWFVNVSLIYNNSRTNVTLKGLDAPIESEIYKALYKKYGRNSTFSDIKINYKGQNTDY